MFRTLTSIAHCEVFHILDWAVCFAFKAKIPHTQPCYHTGETVEYERFAKKCQIMIKRYMLFKRFNIKLISVGLLIILFQYILDS